MRLIECDPLRIEARDMAFDQGSNDVDGDAGAEASAARILRR